MRRDEEREEDGAGALTEPGGKTRLFIAAPLGKGLRVLPDTGQTHYLLHVMRARAGESVLLFNGANGEWRARIAEVTKRGCTLLCEELTEAQDEVPDLWLAFAPIKKIPADYVTQKATELGVRVLQPVITHRTIARRVNTDRLRANAVEAAEQSGRLSVPEIREPVALAALLKAWPRERRLVFCDEGGHAAPIAPALAGLRGQPAGVLIGPEGGFDAEERALIRQSECVTAVTLGPRIMRADTAALAALAIWQAEAGDWR